MPVVIAPILPSEFEATIILESDTICSSLVKLLKFGVLLWRFMNWMHYSGASTALSDNFKSMLCQAFAECDQAAAIDEGTIV